MRQKVEKWRNTVFFQYDLWLRRVKSRLAKAAGAEPPGEMRNEKCTPLWRGKLWALLEVEMSQKCTPLRREAHFQAKMYKTQQMRTTFGSWDVEKLHAVVALSTFRSENVQNTPALDHFWKLRWWRSARRCGAKHISKPKVLKTDGFGALFEVEMLQTCTASWCEAHLEVKMLKNKSTTCLDPFLDVQPHHTTLQLLLQLQLRIQLTNYNYNFNFNVNYTTTTATLQLTLQRHVQLQPQLHYTYHYNCHYHYHYDYHYTYHYTTLHYTSLRFTSLHSTSLRYNYRYNYSYSYNYTTTTTTFTMTTSIAATTTTTTLLSNALQLQLQVKLTLQTTTLQLQLQLQLQPQLQLQQQIQLQLPLHYNYRYHYHYHYTTTTAISTTTTSTVLQLQLQLQYSYNYQCHYTTLQRQLQLQLQLHYTTPRHTTLNCGWVGRCNHSKKHNSNHISVYQWIRSAIRASQKLTSPIVVYPWNFRHRLVRH